MKFLLFGTGDYYNRYKKWFEQREIVALLDNSEQKQHTYIDGFEVLSPEEGVRLKYDIIVILSFYVKQMKQQLVSLGVDENCIFHFYDLHQLLLGRTVKRTLQYFLRAKEIIEDNQVSKAKVLLMSHDLTLGGPAIALFHAAMVFKKHDYEVIYSSMIDGPLRAKLIENNISVVVDENLQLATMNETEWIKSFSLIVCNTLNFHVFLSERDTSIPVIWWFHDAGFFYNGVNKNVMGKISLNNLKAVSAGPVPAEAIGGFLPKISCEELLYGVDDVQSGTRPDKNVHETISFITIGFLEDIKGQDILLKAIKMLPTKVRHMCKFYIVGHNMTLFGEKVKKTAMDISEVIFTGSVSRAEIHKLLNDSDVLICPSRQDSMPTVAAEAMMHFVPCILSDVTGTSAYIHDGEDGFIFKNEDAETLAGRIVWCVENKKDVEEMGRKARRIYEEHFSVPVFEKNLLKIVKDLLESK